MAIWVVLLTDHQKAFIERAVQAEEDDMELAPAAVTRTDCINALDKAVTVDQLANQIFRKKGNE